MRKNNFLSILFVLFSFVATAQTNELKGKEWLNMISNNAIKGDKPGLFGHAPHGYALYFSQAGEIKAPYIVYVPKSYDPTRPTSLVVFLHGAILARDSFRYRDPSIADEPIFSVADTFNTLVVFPFAKRDFVWSGQGPAFENIMNIVNQVEKVYNVNKQKIYIGGISMGGNATFWFINNKPGMFAGFYTFSAMPGQDVTFSNITGEKPLYSMNAKDDQVFSYNEASALYAQKKNIARGWTFQTVEEGGHRFIYNGNTGKYYTKALLGKLLAPSKK